MKYNPNKALQTHGKNILAQSAPRQVFLFLQTEPIKTIIFYSFTHTPHPLPLKKNNNKKPTKTYKLKYINQYIQTSLLAKFSQKEIT